MNFQRRQLMSPFSWLSRWAVLFAACALLALSWVSVALAQVGDDGDGFDGDELLGLPILLGVGILGALAWSLYRRRAPRADK
jgi:type VI protein secretion system component VasK